ncbi:MAG TPA: T9SS type A sorting domain-containing protein [Chitinophagaceae bacterium]
MKRILLVLTFLICVSSLVKSQITTPVIRANFGVDGELRSNYFLGFVQSGNDDWYTFPGSVGTGKFVIDTTGAAATVARYAWDLAFRRLPFFRTMSVPPYSLMNNRLAIDAVFIRDYHGDDSTIFASGSNKNGMSPQDWSCPVSQSIPDKNDILDMFVHVRRQGPNLTDSLWMMGAVSIENTTGNRYFDFEMYQTDIYYDRISRRFYGYGPDAGHTSWTFNATGDILTPGDIIFTAEYSSNSLTAIEARIWTHISNLSLIPQDFEWVGTFDGASSGAVFGYAGIRPKGGGNFYTGLTGGANTWAGPFALIRDDNSLVTNYLAGQFMEFSVNLTKLGLDPVTLLGGNACGMPFRRVLVKSRASTSFTAELKDFVGPFDFFIAPRAAAAADIYLYCGIYGVSNLSVTNAVPSSIYTWTTPDGHIIGSNIGPNIQADMPGMYIVTQQLQSGCPAYAMDTVYITYDPDCSLLENNMSDFRGEIKDGQAILKWTVEQSADINYFEVERSTNGLQFSAIGRITASADISEYTAYDNIQKLGTPYVFYRVRMKNKNGSGKYSKTVRLALPAVLKTTVSINPNPVRNVMNVNFASTANKALLLTIHDAEGKLMHTIRASVMKGNSTLNLTGFDKWPKGIYVVKAVLGEEIFVERVILMK